MSVFLLDGSGVYFWLYKFKVSCAYKQKLYAYKIFSATIVYGVVNNMLINKNHMLTIVSRYSQQFIRFFKILFCSE